MDMSKYGSALFIKPDDVRNGRRRAVIADVSIDEKFDKPNLTFDDGTQLSANKTNVTTLIKAYGVDSDDWLGMEVDLYLGETEYNNTKNESVLVAPISAPRDANNDGGTGLKVKPKPKVEKPFGEMDDGNPF